MQAIVKGVMQLVGYLGLHVGLLFTWIKGLGYFVGESQASLGLFFTILGVMGIGIFAIGGLMSWLVSRRLRSGAIYQPAGWLALFGVFVITVFTLYSGVTSMWVQPFMGPQAGTSP